MLVGVFLLFFSSIYFASEDKFSFFQFPTSGKRMPVGGDVYLDNLPVSKPAIPLAKDKGNFSGSSTAASAIVVDTKTKTVLFSKNTDQIRSLASITKLMTAVVLLDLPINWASTTIITDGDMEGDHHINAGEEFTLDDLWHVALIGSSNSAINALVRNTGMPKEKFVALMNEKAKELRLSSARFAEPTGLSDRNMANALDTAKLLIDALKFEKIYTTVQTGEYYSHPLNGNKARRVWTTNWLLTNWVPNNFKVENIAGKTGYIDDSGYNFAVSLTNEKKHSITVVVFGAATNEDRFSEARDLAEWSFSHYLWPDESGYENLVE
ncbi:MAG: D-alanyl-D-alanine carboxypeptidase family protein [Parcubacteria group bacterium Gr01-1014_13]|nr:MAG: D-alanyl-D-alanine carboxypeptidase family protein [Parcubacteria group bacterium Gr01-1014_13]